MTQYRPVKFRGPADGWTYGIIGEERDKSGSLLRSIIIFDISRDYIFVSHIAAKCTAGQLALDHLLDVIEDLLFFLKNPNICTTPCFSDYLTFLPLRQYTLQQNAILKKFCLFPGQTVK